MLSQRTRWSWWWIRWELSGWWWNTWRWSIIGCTSGMSPTPVAYWRHFRRHCCFHRCSWPSCRRGDPHRSWPKSDPLLLLDYPGTRPILSRLLSLLTECSVDDPGCRTSVGPLRTQGDEHNKPPETRLEMQQSPLEKNILLLLNLFNYFYRKYNKLSFVSFATYKLDLSLFEKII